MRDQTRRYWFSKTATITSHRTNEPYQIREHEDVVNRQALSYMEWVASMGCIYDTTNTMGQSIVLTVCVDGYDHVTNASRSQNHAGQRRGHRGRHRHDSVSLGIWSSMFPMFIR